MRVLRIVNACLSALAVACALGVGVLRRFEPRLLLTYCLMVIMTPVLLCIGGAINNDNLACLGGCACVLGAQLLQLNANSRSGWTLLVVGCTVATFAKLTAGIMAVGFAVIFLGALWQVTGKRACKDMCVGAGCCGRARVPPVSVVHRRLWFSCPDHVSLCRDV